MINKCFWSGFFSLLLLILCHRLSKKRDQTFSWLKRPNIRRWITAESISIQYPHELVLSFSLYTPCIVNPSLILSIQLDSLNSFHHTHEWKREDLFNWVNELMSSFNITQIRGFTHYYILQKQHKSMKSDILIKKNTAREMERQKTETYRNDSRTEYRRMKSVQWAEKSFAMNGNCEIVLCLCT